jgi:uncharacterized protein (DUF2132 family)
LFGKCNKSRRRKWRDEKSNTKYFYKNCKSNVTEHNKVLLQKKGKTIILKIYFKATLAHNAKPLAFTSRREANPSSKLKFWKVLSVNWERTESIYIKM